MQNVAYHILNNDDKASLSVVLLEARQACSGATARNGMLFASVPLPLKFGNLLTASTVTYIEKYEAEAAAVIASLEITKIQAVKALVEKEQIDCDFTLCRAFDGFFTERFDKSSKGADESL